MSPIAFLCLLHSLIRSIIIAEIPHARTTRKVNITVGGAVYYDLAGLGALWLPDYMAREHLARGELVRCSMTGASTPCRSTWPIPPNRHVSAKLRVFIDWIAELMARHAPVIGRPNA